MEGGVAGDLPEIANELVRVASNNSERLVRLINDILDLEKIEAGRLELRLQALDATTLLQSAVAEMAAAATPRQVHFNISEAHELAIVGDPDRLLQVLANLLSNAIKFSPIGGSVDLDFAPSGDGSVRFGVRDRGPGLVPDTIPLLFDRFQQLDSSDARSEGGTGLGLAICKAIVEQHGGHVGVTSTRGDGALFWFEIPGAAAELPIAPVPKSSSVARRQARLGGITTDTASRQAIAAQLQRLGIQAELALADDGEDPNAAQD